MFNFDRSNQFVTNVRLFLLTGANNVSFNKMEKCIMSIRNTTGQESFLQSCFQIPLYIKVLS